MSNINSPLIDCWIKQSVKISLSPSLDIISEREIYMQ